MIYCSQLKVTKRTIKIRANIMIIKIVVSRSPAIKHSPNKKLVPRGYQKSPDNMPPLWNLIINLTILVKEIINRTRNFSWRRHWYSNPMVSTRWTHSELLHLIEPRARSRRDRRPYIKIAKFQANDINPMLLFTIKNRNDIFSHQSCLTCLKFLIPSPSSILEKVAIVQPTEWKSLLLLSLH